MADTDPSSGQASCQLRVPGLSALSFITDFLLPATVFPNLQLKNSVRKLAGSVLVNIHPQRETARLARVGRAPALTHRVHVKGAKVSSLKTRSCFRTFDLTADAEPSRTLTGQGRVEREAS